MIEEIFQVENWFSEIYVHARVKALLWNMDKRRKALYALRYIFVIHIYIGIFAFRFVRFFSSSFSRFVFTNKALPFNFFSTNNSVFPATHCWRENAHSWKCAFVKGFFFCCCCYCCSLLVYDIGRSRGYSRNDIAFVEFQSNNIHILFECTLYIRAYGIFVRIPSNDMIECHNSNDRWFSIWIDEFKARRTNISIGFIFFFFFENA